MKNQSLRIRASDIRGIVFDAVGTLIEPRPTVSEAYASAAWRQGVTLAPELLKQRFRIHFKEAEAGESANPYITDESCERRRWRWIVEGCLPEVPDRDVAFEDLWRHFGDPKSWHLFADATQAIANWDESGLRCGIASNFDRRLRSVLAGLNLPFDWAEQTAISSEVGYRKPHPAFYEAVSKLMKLAPHEILFVGDDVENDYFAAIRAGFQAVLIDRDSKALPEVLSVENLVDLARDLRPERL